MFGIYCRKVFDPIRRAWRKGGYYALVLVFLGALGLGAYRIKTKPRAAVAPTKIEAAAQDAREGASSSALLSATAAPLPSLAWPVAGRVILRAHEPDQLLWSEHLRQYETHTGIDIQAAPGEPVCAAADGTVRAVYADALMGYTVEIAHERGLATIYQNLLESPPVAIGARVRQGDVIGAVGASAIVERGAHLHFEAWYMGAFVAIAN